MADSSDTPHRSKPRTGAESLGEEGPSLRDLLKRIDDNYSGLRSDFHEWKVANHEDKKGIYRRLSELEEKALFIPNAEEANLIKEASAYYKSKRELKERMYHTLIEKGLTGLIVFAAAAVFYYIKYLMTGDV